MGNNKKINKSIVTSEAFPGILLLATTILALILANSPINYAPYYAGSAVSTASLSCTDTILLTPFSCMVTPYRLSASSIVGLR